MSARDKEQTRFEKKLLAARRAQKRLEQRLEMIDWELDELAPEVARLRELGAAGELPRITVESEA